MENKYAGGSFEEFLKEADDDIDLDKVTDALNETDNLPETWFGKAEASREELPLVQADVEGALNDIKEQVDSTDIEKLPKALRASANRALKALRRKYYFDKTFHTHLFRVIKKAKMMFDENSKEYAEVKQWVEKVKE